MVPMQAIIYKGKGKCIPITGQEDPRGMWMRGPTYSQQQNQEGVGWLVLRSAAFTPQGSPPVLILQEVEWTSGPIWTRRRKSPPLRYPGSNPVRLACKQAPCRLSHVATCIIFITLNRFLDNILNFHDSFFCVIRYNYSKTHPFSQSIM